MAMAEPVQSVTSLDELPDVLTTRDMAGVLRCSEKHVQDLCREDRIPCFKLGRLWRSSKTQFVRWIENE